jgi:hypothetical protein
MTRDDIIRMAEECGIPEFENNESQADSILRFAALVTAAERKRFAEECIDLVALYGGPIDLEAAIRARGETK